MLCVPRCERTAVAFQAGKNALSERQALAEGERAGDVGVDFPSIIIHPVVEGVSSCM